MGKVAVVGGSGSKGTPLLLEFGTWIWMSKLTCSDVAREVIDAILQKGNHEVMVCSRKVRPSDISIHRRIAERAKSTLA